MNDEAEELPQLTDKQYKFVEGKLKGLSNAEAYRQAYPGTSTKPETVWRRAAEVASNTKVLAWLAFHKAEAIRKLTDEATYTLQAHIDELNDAIEFAKQCNSAPTVHNAVVSKGKACNLYVEHKNININNKSDLTLIERIAKEFGTVAAREAAQNMGYKPAEVGLDKHLDS